MFSRIVHLGGCRWDDILARTAIDLDEQLLNRCLGLTVNRFSLRTSDDGLRYFCSGNAHVSGLGGGLNSSVLKTR